MSTLKYWLWLSCARDIAAKKMTALTDYFGSPENVYFAAESDYDGVPGLTPEDKRSLCDKSLDKAEKILARCREKNISILTISDAAYPERLKNIYDPPCVLYIKGRLPNIDEEAAVAVVGTRGATAYGLSVTDRICFELAASGMLIVSGLAQGIDAAAHTAAARAASASVSVLGGGVDVVYPRQNRSLYEHIALHGALISEYPPGTPPIGRHFPVRNRIISGLALGVLVTEAPEKSGALITASLALDQGRDVFAVPGNIGVASSAGCNALIRDGAQIVTGSLDVLKEYMPLYPHKIALAPQGKAKGGRVLPEKAAALPEEPPGNALPDREMLEERIKSFTDEQRAIIVTIAGRMLHVDDIIAETHLSAQTVLAQLTLLEMSGAVEQAPGKYFNISSSVWDHA